MIKYACLFFSFLSPSSFWFSKVEVCYLILAEDLALCTGCRRASLINFHYWIEMKKKPRIFSFFFLILSHYFAWNFSCRNSRSLYSILPVSSCFSRKMFCTMQTMQNHKWNIDWQKMCDLFQAGILPLLLQASLTIGVNQILALSTAEKQSVCIERY